MNADIQAKLDAIKAPFQSVIEATDALPALVDSYAKEVGDARYVEGQNSMAIPSPTLPDGTVDPTLKYTQEQVDKMAEADRIEKENAVASAILQAKAEEQAKYNELLATVEGKDALIASADADKVAAVEAKRKEIMDDYLSTKVDDASFEAKHSV